MKQILQNLSSGETTVVNVPLPNCPKAHVRIRTVSTLISLGTERMLVEFGRGNLLQKVRQQPDKVKMVLEKAGTDGAIATYEAVRSKLDQPLPLGYCQAGVVLDSNDTEFCKGDRVMSNGNHAEVVCISRNLVAKIPDNVTFDEASFTPVAAIGLQGIRLVSPQIGETVVVMGLGLIGLLTVQLLIAQGCQVIGIDYDAGKLAIAEKYGASVINLSVMSDSVSEVLARTNHRGADSVIITASAKSNDLVSNAANMCRQRGKIVLVGVTGLKLNRADFYEKELTFQVSCSYGPGRYDPFHEEMGNDYPIGFVRWTEKRNFDAILQLMSSGVLNVKDLVSAKYSIEEATEAYDRVATDKSALGLIIDYPNTEEPNSLLSAKVLIGTKKALAENVKTKTNCAVIGSGNYASRVLIPLIKKNDAILNTIVSSGGVTAAHHGAVNGFEYAATDVKAVFENREINTVVIATRHDSHADLVIESIKSGKNVFVEKPLVLNQNELDRVKQAIAEVDQSKLPNIMVGFNRRYSPQVVKMKNLLDAVTEPKCFVMTMNAGAIPADSWVQSDVKGGGRIIGEACHYIDLMRHLVGHPITSIQAMCIGKNNHFEINEDKASITLGFKDGSMGTIHYLANGSKKFPKERIEVFAQNAVLQIDNFRKFKGYGWPGFKNMNLLKQDKGQSDCVKRFIESVNDGNMSPIPLDEILEVAQYTLDAVEIMRSQKTNDH